MNQIHKADEYDFSQLSKSGKKGFESLKNDGNGRFYFHFNDAKGQPFLFSQAYARESTRDKGIQSVLKNIVLNEQIERFTTEGGIYFVVKASNNQEIARSRIFKSSAELDTHLSFLQSHANEKTGKILPVTDLAIKKNADNSFALASENADLKTMISALESQLAEWKKRATDTENLSDDTLRHVFRLEFYKNNSTERFYGKITHPFSSQSQTFYGFDSPTILSFMVSFLQADLSKAGERLSQNINLVPPQYETPNRAQSTDDAHPLQDIQPSQSIIQSTMRAVNLAQNEPFLQHNQPFTLILSPQNDQEGLTDGQMYQIEVKAFNLDKREHLTLLSQHIKAVSYANKPDFFLKAEPLVLSSGNYRLNFLAYSLSKSAKVIQWQGSLIVQVYR